MNGGTIAAVIVAFFGLISGLGAAWLSYRAQKNTASADEVATAFKAYDDLLKNLRAEVDRLREQARSDGAGYGARLRSATEELTASETRCRECRAEVSELLADLAALRAVVVDEAARTAAGVAIAHHADPSTMTPAERAELDAIRRFIGRLPHDKENP